MDVFTRMMSFIKNCKKFSNLGESAPLQSQDTDLSAISGAIDAIGEHSGEGLLPRQNSKCQLLSNSCSSQALNAAPSIDAGADVVQTWQSCPSSPASHGAVKNGSAVQQISGKFAVSVFSPTICLSTVSIRQCLDVCSGQKDSEPCSSMTAVPASLSGLPGRVDVCVVQPQALSKIKHCQECNCDNVKNFNVDNSVREIPVVRDLSAADSKCHVECNQLPNLSELMPDIVDIPSEMKQLGSVSFHSAAVGRSNRASVGNNRAVKDGCGSFESKGCYRKPSRLPVLESSPARTCLLKITSGKISPGAGNYLEPSRAALETNAVSLTNRDSNSLSKQKQNLSVVGEQGSAYCLPPQCSSVSDSGFVQTKMGRSHCSRRSSGEGKDEVLPHKTRSLLPVLGSLRGKQITISSAKIGHDQELSSQSCDSAMTWVCSKSVECNRVKSPQGSLKPCPVVKKEEVSSKSSRSSPRKIFRLPRSSSLKNRKTNDEWNIPAGKGRSRSQEDHRRGSTLFHKPRSVEGSPVSWRYFCHPNPHAVGVVESSVVHASNQCNTVFYDARMKPWATTLRGYEKSPSPVRSRKSTPESAGLPVSNSALKDFPAFPPSSTLNCSLKESRAVDSVSQMLGTRVNAASNTKLRQSGGDSTVSGTFPTIRHRVKSKSSSKSSSGSGSDSEKTPVFEKKLSNNTKSVKSLKPAKMRKTSNENSNKKQQKTATRPKSTLSGCSSCRHPGSRSSSKEQNCCCSQSSQRKYLCHQKFDLKQNNGLLEIRSSPMKIFEDPSDLRNQLPTEEALDLLLAVSPAIGQSSSRKAKNQEICAAMDSLVSPKQDFLSQKNDAPFRIDNDAKPEDLSHPQKNIINFCKFDDSSSDIIVIEKHLLNVSKAVEIVYHETECTGLEHRHLKNVPIEKESKLELGAFDQISFSELARKSTESNEKSEGIGIGEAANCHVIPVDGKKPCDGKCAIDMRGKLKVTDLSTHAKSDNIYDGQLTVVPIKVIGQTSSLAQAMSTADALNSHNGTADYDEHFAATGSQIQNVASKSSNAGIANYRASRTLYASMPPFGEWISRRHRSIDHSAGSLVENFPVCSGAPAPQKSEFRYARMLSYPSERDNIGVAPFSVIDNQVHFTARQSISKPFPGEVSEFNFTFKSKESATIENNDTNKIRNSAMPGYRNKMASRFVGGIVPSGCHGDKERINRPLTRDRPFQRSFSFIDSRPELISTRFVDEAKDRSEIQSSVFNPEQRNKSCINCIVNRAENQNLCGENHNPDSLTDAKNELVRNLETKNVPLSDRTGLVSSLRQSSSPLPVSDRSPPPLHYSHSDAVLTRQDSVFGSSDNSSSKTRWYISDIENVEFLDDLLLRRSCASLPQNLKRKPAFTHGQRTLLRPRSAEYAKHRSPELSCFRKSRAVSPDSDDEFDVRSRRHDDMYSSSTLDRVHARFLQRIFGHRGSTCSKESCGTPVDSLDSSVSSAEGSISREDDRDKQEELNIRLNHYRCFTRRGRHPYYGCCGDLRHTPPLAVFLSNEDISASVFPLRHVVSEPVTSERFTTGYMSGLTDGAVAKERPKSDGFDVKLSSHLRHQLDACFAKYQTPKFTLGEKLLDLADSRYRELSPSTTSDQPANVRLRMGHYKSMSQPHLIKRRVPQGPPSDSRGLCFKSCSLPTGLDQRPANGAATQKPKDSGHFVGGNGKAQGGKAAEFSSIEDLENPSLGFASDMIDRSAVNRQLSFGTESGDDGFTPVLVEALWDHVTLDQDELSFQSGDVIEVIDRRDRYWWWGRMGQTSGWCPSSFVSLRRPQTEALSSFEEMEKLSRRRRKRLSRSPPVHTRTPSMGRSRTNVIREIIKAESDYVKHLRDVVEGYLEKARKRPDMFSDEKIAVIFGNIHDIYQFSRMFLSELEKRILADSPGLSEIGQCFINSRKGFEIYSEYCNNHPLAIEELCYLQQDEKYRRFFELCRLQQKMIEIPLEGFLLTPIQKVCKYPLQLKELIKYTWPSHPDHCSLREALDAMKGIATLINERKRKMESLEKLTHWQANVAGWQGAPLIEKSSELIYSGELTKINSRGWHQGRVFFLFDHQLVYCKKDILWRHLLIYRGRIDVDHCVIHLIPDGRDVMFGIFVKNAWKLYDHLKDKWYLLMTRTAKERDRWLQAFEDERRCVLFDKENGFILDRFKQPMRFAQRKRKVNSKKSLGRHPRKRVTIQKLEDVEKPSANRN